MRILLVFIFLAVVGCQSSEQYWLDESVRVQKISYERIATQKDLQ